MGGVEWSRSRNTGMLRYEDFASQVNEFCWFPPVGNQ